MVDILDPKEGETIYDPACGTGGMLLAAVEHVRDKGGDPRTFFGKLFGQEKNLTTSSVARMNLLLHGVEDFQIQRGDTLRRPAFADADGGGLATFDVVIANPPFSLKNWGREVWESDPWGRAFAGLPTDNSGDYAWLQHMISSMRSGHGRMAVVLPQGVTYREGVEGKIRKYILQEDLLDAVVCLPPNIFYGTTLDACVLVLKRTKATERRGRVLLVDASSLFTKEGAKNRFMPEHSLAALQAVRAATSNEVPSRFVTLSEIERLDWSINVRRYIPPARPTEEATLGEQLKSLSDAQNGARRADSEFSNALRNMRGLQ
jgi:type I restriction enzyme M protein